MNTSSSDSGKVVLEGMFSSKNVWILANIACTIALAVQLAHVLEGFVKPRITRTWEEEVSLEDINFPLIIKGCVIPGFNKSAIQELGYESVATYLAGQSKFNESLYGWAGHTNKSEIIGSVGEILRRIDNVEVKSIFNGVAAITEVDTKDQPFQIDFKYLKNSRVNYPNNCRSLSLSDVPGLNGKRISQLFFDLKGLGNYTVEIHLGGDTIESRRPIKEHKLYSTGDPIKIMHPNMWRAWIVDITQQVFVEEDPNNDCRVYPNQEYQSYEDCDTEFARKVLHEALTPVWMTDDVSAVSTHVFDENGTFQTFSGRSHSA